MAIKITVKLGAPLSQVVGEKRVTLSMSKGTTVSGVMAELGTRYPDFEDGLKGKGLRKPFDRTLYTLFLNARPIPWEQTQEIEVHDGDRVYLFLPVAGG